MYKKYPNYVFYFAVRSYLRSSQRIIYMQSKELTLDFEQLKMLSGKIGNE